MLVYHYTTDSNACGSGHKVVGGQTAVTVARAVVKNFRTIFVFPLIIHTDQGRNFESDLHVQSSLYLAGNIKDQDNPDSPMLKWPG